MKRTTKESVVALFVILCIVIVMIEPVLIILPIFTVVIYFVYRERLKRKRRNALLMAGDIDSMTGGEFEEMLEVVFFNLGYKTKLAGKTGGGEFWC